MFDNPLHQITKRIIKSYSLGGINKEDTQLPSKGYIIETAIKIQEIIFPGFIGAKSLNEHNLEHWTANLINNVYFALREIISKSIEFIDPNKCEGDCVEAADLLALKFLHQLAKVRELLLFDVEAAYDGDPAAKNQEEIIISYPGVLAVTYYRIAHEFYILNIPLIPRIICEYAHSLTGCDIHPGAKIGKSFFIDHATGVVIGETAVVGNNVKIYQHVTLGAMNFKKNKDGELIRDIKRHPTIGDNVTLYSGCSILGGNTVIGSGSIIGGNVWLTQSVPSNTVVLFDVENAKYVFSEKRSKTS